MNKRCIWNMWMKYLNGWMRDSVDKIWLVLLFDEKKPWILWFLALSTDRPTDTASYGWVRTHMKCFLTVLVATRPFFRRCSDWKRSVTWQCVGFRGSRHSMSNLSIVLAEVSSAFFFRLSVVGIVIFVGTVSCIVQLFLTCLFLSWSMFAYCCHLRCCHLRCCHLCCERARSSCCSKWSIHVHVFSNFSRTE